MKRNRFVFGGKSATCLDTCHTELRETAYHAISFGIYDFTIVWGYRNKEQQELAYSRGNSDKRFPGSKHNTVDRHGQPCSDAFDFAPWCKLPNGKYGIPWDDTHAFAVVGGIILAAAADIGYDLEYGGDWDMDGLTTDQTLMDWGHVQRKS